MRTILRLIGVAATAAFFLSPSKADAIVYVLPDIGTFSTYIDTNTSDTFTGDGFVGEYPPDLFPPEGAWAHLFGLECNATSCPYSETLIQVDLSGLGSSVGTAILSFDILDFVVETESGTIYGWGGTGNLMFALTPPGTNYGSDSVTFTFGSNSDNVTNLVNAALASGNPWLDLLLIGNGPSGHLWTFSGTGSDAALARLTVTAPVPEPATLTLLGACLAGLGFARRRNLK